MIHEVGYSEDSVMPRLSMRGSTVHIIIILTNTLKN